MRPAPSRWRHPRMALVASAIAAVVFTCVSILFGTAPVAFAEITPLEVQVDEVLGLVDRATTVDVSGGTFASSSGSKLVVTFKGPVSPTQVGSTAAGQGTAHEVTRTLRSRDLAEGSLEVTVDVPASSLSAPGAYLVIAEVLAGGEVLARGTSWIGRITPRETPLDVSFVLPVYLGIHRDWTGRFVDTVIEDATLPVESGNETLRALAPLADNLPSWNLSVALEPILLTQLRDMADGYVFGETEAEQSEIDANDLASQSAAATVTDLAGLAARDSVEILASSHTGADLNLLAAEGWRDGLDAIQMGKEELQSTLGIETPLVGAYAPSLYVTAAALGYYADASVEYVVVGSSVLASLSENAASGTATLRVENGQNDRVTLVVSSELVSAAVREPWDTGLFAAALAADLADTPRSAIVIAPEGDYTLIPAEYVQNIGALLTSQSWLRTQKVQDLISLHQPDSRPVLLEDITPEPDGYIADRLFEAVRESHGPVSDLASATDMSRTEVNQAVRLLYAAESRWWSRSGTSPAEASSGLAYARQAALLAEAELKKVTFTKASAPLVSGRSSTISVSIENSADYTIRAELVLSGEGLSLPNGDSIAVELQPGRTDLEVEVVSEGGSQELTGTLLVGSTPVDEFTHSVGSVGLWTILPWVIAVCILLGGVGAYVWIRRRSPRSGSEQHE